jgi:Skp family chaperone for outer membrane proteins
VEVPVAEPVKAKKKRKPKAKAEMRTENDCMRKALDAAALAREEALRKVEEEQQALREARAKQRELEEELLERRKQVCIYIKTGISELSVPQTSSELTLSACIGAAV